MPKEIMRGLEVRKPNTIYQNIERKRFLYRLAQFKQNSPQARLYLFGLSGISFLYSSYLFVNKQQAQKEIEFRKAQLSKPTYDLSGAEAYNLPWSNRNLNEWKYRTVTIRGRPLHYKQALIPTKSYGLSGFECIVPLVTKEKEDGTEQEGVLLSLGFIPQEYWHHSTRYRQENADWQNFTGYVSTLDQYSGNHGVLSDGNVGGLGNNLWSSADIGKMADLTGFQNSANIQHSVIESINLEAQGDERNGNLRDISCSYREDFPYAQTVSGALQTPVLPWQYQNKANTANLFGGVFLGLAAVLTFV